MKGFACEVRLGRYCAGATTHQSWRGGDVRTLGAICGARRMAETAALLADDEIPERPLPQCVLALPYALRFLLVTDPDALKGISGARMAP